MDNFMLNDDAHDTTNCDGKTLLSGACSAAACPLFSLFAAHNNIIKDVQIPENSSKKGQKLSNKSIPDVDVQDQDNNNVRYSKVAHIPGFFSSYLRFLCPQCIGSF